MHGVYMCGQPGVATTHVYNNDDSIHCFFDQCCGDVQASGTDLVQRSLYIKKYFSS